MTSRSIRFPSDVWRAIELTARKEGMSAADVVRIGALSYAAFMAARRDDESAQALGALFDAAREAARAWPL